MDYIVHGVAELDTTETLSLSEEAKCKVEIQKTCKQNSVTAREIDGETVETVTDLILGGSLQMVTAAMKLKGACYFEEKL